MAGLLLTLTAGIPSDQSATPAMQLVFWQEGGPYSSGMWLPLTPLGVQKKPQV
jgi:hypothetical protein